MLGDARATVLSMRRASEEQVGSECGAVLAAEGARPTSPERGVLGQAETSACGEGASASGETWKAKSGAGKAQGGSVPRGRRADCDRGEKERGKGSCRQDLDEAWLSVCGLLAPALRGPFRCGALRQAFSLREGVRYQMRFSPTSQDVLGAISPAEWFVVAGFRRASRPAGIGLPNVRESCGRRADKF